MILNERSSPMTLVVRGLLLIAAAALALFNGSLWSPFFNSVAYILYLTTRGFPLMTAARASDVDAYRDCGADAAGRGHTRSHLRAHQGIAHQHYGFDRHLAGRNDAPDAAHCHERRQRPLTGVRARHCLANATVGVHPVAPSSTAGPLRVGARVAGALAMLGGAGCGCDIGRGSSLTMRRT